ncbi:MAG: tripartite tricarboxylate transporter TctB family protein [Candidatus Rokubacteria bacterium]|nr:tripartite tricarboxylate transporter TctB family protein [Candidatus Rokubacteria bacterium]
MHRAETAISALWTLLGIGITADAVQLGIWEPAGPASGFVPLLAGVVIGIGGIALLLRRPSRADGRRFWESGAPALRVGAVLGALAVIAVLMDRLGFVLTAIPMMVFLLTVIERQRWTWVIGLAIGASVGLYWLFDRVLEMSLPKGPLGF